MYTFGRVLHFRKSFPSLSWLDIAVQLWPIFYLGFLPSVFYRACFKATSLIYSPFIWVALVTLRSSSCVKLRLERITKGELEKTGRRYLSTLALSALAAKIVLVFGSTSVIDIIALFFDRKFVESMGGFLLSAGLTGEVHNIWPWWPFVLLGTAALLSFGLFYYSDAALSRLDSKDSRDAWPEQNVITIVSTAAFLRASLAVVVMAYFFQRALMAVVGAYFVVPDV